MIIAWNKGMDDAPKGRVVYVTRKIGKEERTFEEFKREYVLVADRNHAVSMSYFIPPKYTASGALLEGDRWSGFNHGDLPIAWAEWPKYEGSEA